jgi:preprotein translocase subunit SecF
VGTNVGNRTKRHIPIRRPGKVPRQKRKNALTAVNSNVRKNDRETPMAKKISPNDPRIAKKFSGDRTWSLVAVIVLWALYAFVFYEVKGNLSSPDVAWTLAVFGGLVLLFNTAAILAMIAHLSEEREEIYGLDLHYVDLAKNKSKS